jgi:hypothetical protein
MSAVTAMTNDTGIIKHVSSYCHEKIPVLQNMSAVTAMTKMPVL